MNELEKLQIYKQMAQGFSEAMEGVREELHERGYAVPGDMEWMQIQMNVLKKLTDKKAGEANAANNPR